MKRDWFEAVVLVDAVVLIGIVLWTALWVAIGWAQ